MGKPYQDFKKRKKELTLQKLALENSIKKQWKGTYKNAARIVAFSVGGALISYGVYKAVQMIRHQPKKQQQEPAQTAAVPEPIPAPSLTHEITSVLKRELAAVLARFARQRLEHLFKTIQKDGNDQEPAHRASKE